MKFKVLVLPFILMACNTYATDFDDGIEVDTPIEDGIKTDTNIQFIKSKAKSKARRGNGSNTCGVGSVVIEAGADVPKEINIVGDFKNTTAVCGK